MAHDNVGVCEFRNGIPKEWNVDFPPSAEYDVYSPWLTGNEGDMYVLHVDRCHYVTLPSWA
jgi:hypothetical protein